LEQETDGKEEGDEFYPGYSLFSYPILLTDTFKNIVQIQWERLT